MRGVKIDISSLSTLLVSAGYRNVSALGRSKVNKEIEHFHHIGFGQKTLRLTSKFVHEVDIEKNDA